MRVASIISVDQSVWLVVIESSTGVRRKINYSYRPTEEEVLED